MAEWLRRWTRNPMGYSRAGSNPARSVVFSSPRNNGKNANIHKHKIHVLISIDSDIN